MGRDSGREWCRGSPWSTGGPHWASPEAVNGAQPGSRVSVEHVAVGEVLDEEARRGRASSRRAGCPGCGGRCPTSGDSLARAGTRRPPPARRGRPPGRRSARSGWPAPSVIASVWWSAGDGAAVAADEAHRRAAVALARVVVEVADDHAEVVADTSSAPRCTSVRLQHHVAEPPHRGRRPRRALRGVGASQLVADVEELRAPGAGSAAPSSWVPATTCDGDSARVGQVHGHPADASRAARGSVCPWPRPAVCTSRSSSGGEGGAGESRPGPAAHDHARRAGVGAAQLQLVGGAVAHGGEAEGVREGLGARPGRASRTPARRGRATLITGLRHRPGCSPGARPARCAGQCGCRRCRSWPPSSLILTKSSHTTRSSVKCTDEIIRSDERIE